MSNQVIQPNKYIELDINDIGSNGEGIGRYDKYTVFVPFALAGERIKAQVEHVKKNIAFARLIKVLNASNYRIDVTCNRFQKCGGCDLLHLNYRKQLEYKQTSLERTLLKMLDKVYVDKTVESIPNIRYRNKIQVPFGKLGDRVVLGFYLPKTHRVVSITKCFLQNEMMDMLLELTLKFVNDNDISVYENGSGLLRYLFARYIDNALFVTLVINGNSVSNIGDYYKMLVGTFKKVSLSLCVNKENTNVILSNNIINIDSNVGRINYMGLSIQLHPLSFLQINDYIASKIYKRIIDFVVSNKIERVIDAYGGVGILGALIAKESNAKIINIDIVKEAIEDAKALGEINGINHKIDNICADSKDVLKNIVDNNKDFKTLIIVDPPRKGLSNKVCQIINNIEHDISLVYISCNPATLARDLSKLTNYNISSITPYDMFANTYHLETLVFLSKKN